MLDSGVLPHSGCLAAHVAAHDAAPGPTAVTGYMYGFSLDYDDTGEVEQLVDVQDADAAIERMAAKQLHGDIRDPCEDSQQAVAAGESQALRGRLER
jgi:hypothetical protein